MVEKKEKKRINPRAFFDCLMGIIYVGVGLFLVVAVQTGYSLYFPPQEFALLFGIIASLYGLFRGYRGYVSFYQSDT